jgi:type II restriction/modification system DNA methylase subunit YeeA
VSLIPSQFAGRWRVASLSERSGAQSHFIDLCEMLGQPHPAAADAIGERYTFEKRVPKVYGGKGFADVWFRDHFAWEYKGPHKDLKTAYKQLNDYREDLLNPPLLVVSDFDRFEIHTNFANTKKRVYEFNLSDLERNQVTASCPLPPLEVLRALFDDYNVLRPDRTDARVTQEVALLFTRLAERLELEERNLGATKEQIAHFLMRLLFCLFADSVGLLPKHLFRSLIQSDDRFFPKKFLRKLSALFRAMSDPDVFFGEHTIKYFNGGLFDSDSVIALDTADLGILYQVAANYDWSHIAPAIFGTLFERSLDPARRSLIGAHYTSEEDILLLIEPVIMDPLQKRWAHVRDSILVTLGLPTTAESAPTARPSIAQAKSGRNDLRGVGSISKGRSLFSSNPEAERLCVAWFDSLSFIRILDPACGSGNFLYVALRRLLDLWKEARDFAIQNNIQIAITYAVQKMPSPTQLFGIESEFYAHELASIVVWIGFLQWKHEHGITEDREPILQKLENIEHADAIMRYCAEGKSYEPAWPAADFIIGNPPFLGDKRMRGELGDEYVDELRTVYEGRVPGGADLVTYWFEKARVQLKAGKATRAGLLATQTIRGGANSTVLERILETGGIFMAWSDRPWILEGAAVRVSLIGFDDGSQTPRTLDGQPVDTIHSDLTSKTNVTGAKRLPENSNLSFKGVTLEGPFDITSKQAEKMLAAPLNPNGRPNSDVVRRILKGRDVVQTNQNGWLIDFGEMPESEAAFYELPFEYVRREVKPIRDVSRRKRTGRRWWLHGENRPGLRKALTGLSRCIVTPGVAKHRIFVWMSTEIVPDQKLCVIPRDDDYFFGVLQSRLHEEWSLSTGSWIGVGNDPSYTSARTFDTFPFPWPPGKERSGGEDPQVRAIAEAARELVRLRDVWLNPLNASEDDLKERTLTKLYNKRPAWLENAHQTLDHAVFAAYGLAYPLSKDEIIRHLLELNRERAAGHVRLPVSDLPPKKSPGRERLPKRVRVRAHAG